MLQASQSPKSIPKISVIIPVINEAGRISQAIERAWEIGDEVIVVDGGSADGTVELAGRLRCTIASSNRGRGQQLNVGSQLASGDVLLFLHADNWLGGQAKSQIVNAFQTCSKTGQFYGCFRQSIDAESRLYRLIEKGNFARARWQRLIYGDQGLFISRPLFDEVSGFPEISLMEDFEISRRLRRVSRPALLDGPIHVDSRRWQQFGPIRLTIRNWMFAIGYRCGLSPETLASIYNRK